jgi:hypothetical protein
MRFPTIKKVGRTGSAAAVALLLAGMVAAQAGAPDSGRDASFWAGNQLRVAHLVVP